MKSETCSIRFPAWFLGRNPQKSIIGCSYSDNKAYTFSYAVREVISGPKYQRLWPLKLATSGAMHWQLTGKNDLRPSYIAAGVGGGITGEGANCFPAGTIITTSVGPLPIENLQFTKHKVLSYDVNKHEMQWQNTEAFSIRQESRLYRIRTSSGRVVKATANHRFWTNRGYKKACELAPGDTLLCLVQERISTPSLRDAEVSQIKIRDKLLFGQLQKCPRGYQTSSSLYNLRSACCQKDSKILRTMQATANRKTRAYRTPIFSYCLPDVQSGISCEMARLKPREICNLLLKKMRRAWPFASNVWEGKSEMEEWGISFEATTPFRQSLSYHQAYNTGKRRSSMPCLWSDSQTARSSYRQLANEQCSIKFSDTLCNLSPKTTSCVGIEAVSDTVAVVECLRESAIVYDLQVSNNHNFFANGILVHNCLIIDDPIKNKAEADSKTIRDSIWQWYITTALTRLQPDGAKIVIMTRWHADDLVGRLLKVAASDPKADQWEVIHFKAINEKGEALWPEKFPVDYLEKVRSGQIDNPDEPGAGSRAFASLYQGSPSVAEGNIFRREWWKYYREFPACQRLVHSWDTAFETKRQNDYSVCTVWGMTASGYYIKDIWRGRVEFPELKRVAISLFDRDKPVAVLIEDAASGKSLKQELRSGTKMPIIPVKVDKDKVVRANSASPTVEAGKVFIPESAPWLFDFVEELSAFPSGEHDDIVDSVTQFLNWARGRSGGGQTKPFWV